MYPATAALPTIPKVFSNVFFEHVNRAANEMRAGFRERVDMATLDLAVVFIDLVSSTQWMAATPRAAHAAKEAEPGRVVVTQSVLSAATAAGYALSTSPLEARRLRGIADDVVLFVLDA